MTFLVCRFCWLMSLMKLYVVGCMLMLPSVVHCLMLLLSSCDSYSLCAITVFVLLLFYLLYLCYDGP